MNNCDFKKLIVWQKSMDLASKIYDLVKLLPKEEIHVLSFQMRRAAISIPSNIAEGHGRNSDKEFINFLYIALGSLRELDTQLHLTICINYFKNEDILPINSLISEISKMIVSLIESVKKRSDNKSLKTEN